MKKMYIISIIVIVFIFCSCNNETKTKHATFYSAEEISSIIADNNLSNSKKTDIICKMTEDELRRADKYKQLIKDKYNKRVTDYSLIFENFNLDSAYQTLDDYCKYLENEFDNNIEFFNDFVMVKYQSGSYGSIWLAENEYKCAKEYADKLQSLYEELS